MNIGLFILAPFIIPFSPFLFMISSLKLANDCNQVTSAKLLNISEIDMFRCEAQLYIPEYDHYASIRLQCSEFVQNNLTDIMVIINKSYKEKACLKIVKSNEDEFVDDYDNTIMLFYTSLIGICLFILGIIGNILQQ
jgi:hypothetical protein